jgi:hypothetical protein
MKFIATTANQQAIDNQLTDGYFPGYPFKAGQHAGATNEVCQQTNFVCRSTVSAKVDSLTYTCFLPT